MTRSRTTVTLTVEGFAATLQAHARALTGAYIRCDRIGAPESSLLAVSIFTAGERYGFGYDVHDPLDRTHEHVHELGAAIRRAVEQMRADGVVVAPAPPLSPALPAQGESK